MRVDSVQFQHVAGDKQYNLQQVEKHTRLAADEGSQLIVFPECCLTGYWHLRKLTREQLLLLAESAVTGPLCQRLTALSKETGVTVGAGYIELADDGRLFNSYYVSMPDGRWANHRKLHCFISEPLDSGDTFTPFEHPSGARLGVLICYDNNIVENVRATALAGAQVLLAPHQTGGCKSGSPFAMGRINVALWKERESRRGEIETEFKGDKGRGWLMRWLPSRAHDNGIFIIFSNGVGQDDNEVRTGNAMILDPYGRILNETWAAEDVRVSADLDLSLIERSTGARWIKARRPELYDSLLKSKETQVDTRKVRFEFDDEVSE